MTLVCQYRHQRWLLRSPKVFSTILLCSASYLPLLAVSFIIGSSNPGMKAASKKIRVQCKQPVDHFRDALHLVWQGRKWNSLWSSGRF